MAHSELTDVTTAQHHTLYTDAQAVAAAGLKSTVVNEARTAAAATGSVSYTGAGGKPLAAIITAIGKTGNDNMSWGAADDANGERAIQAVAMTGTMALDYQSTLVIHGSNPAGSNVQRASLTTFDEDGMTLSWTKVGSGEQITFIVLYLFI